MHCNEGINRTRRAPHSSRSHTSPSDLALRVQNLPNASARRRRPHDLSRSIRVPPGHSDGAIHVVEGDRTILKCEGLPKLIGVEGQAIVGYHGFHGLEMFRPKDVLFFNVKPGAAVARESNRATTSLNELHHSFKWMLHQQLPLPQRPQIRHLLASPTLLHRHASR